MNGPRTAISGLAVSWSLETTSATMTAAMATEAANSATSAARSELMAEVLRTPSGQRVFYRMSSVSAAPESSPFGMNPRAPLRCTSGPKSELSRLEVSTTAGAPSTLVIRAATSKPSMSGRLTSSSTRSGLSSPAAVIAVRPSGASPTTSKPSLSNSRRAVDRKVGWSSTMRTFVLTGCINHRPYAGPQRYGWLHPGRGGDVAVGLARVRRPEQRAAGHEQRGAGVRRGARGRRVDAAVDLHVDVVADEAAQPRDLVRRRGDEPLAAPARVDGHAQRHVDVDLAVDVQRRRGADGHAGRAAQLADLPDDVVDVRRRLGVDGDVGGAGLREVRDVALRALHHQVHVVGDVGQAELDERAQHLRAHRQRRHEVAVHDVDVDDAGARVDDLGDLGAEAGGGGRRGAPGAAARARAGGGGGDHIP